MRTLDQVMQSVSATPAADMEENHPETSSGCVLVAIPAYNEERFIGSVVLQAKLQGYSVLVIDDGSTDQTAAIATAAGARVESHELNMGKVEALNTAFSFARTIGMTQLVVMDGDSQHAASEIGSVLAPIRAGEADIVIGSRFLTTSGGRIPVLRSLGQRVMTLAANLGSGTPVTDSQSGFRAFSRRAIESLVFRGHGFSVEVEMQFQAHDHSLRVVEVPITAQYTDPPKRNVLSHGAQVSDGVLRMASRHRPLLFFGAPGAVVLLMGLGLGMVVANIYHATQVLAVGYSLITVLAVILGILGLFTGFTLYAIRGTFVDLEKRLVAGRNLSPALWPIQASYLDSPEPFGTGRLGDPIGSVDGR